MIVAAWVLGGLAALIGFGFVCRWLLRNPRADVETGLFWHFSRLYAAVLHRLRRVGMENVPRRRLAGPMIVVANHTAGVDPILIQSGCEFEIRWLMTENMRHPLGEFFWRWTQVIFVGRRTGELRGTRYAISYVKAGGVLGVFPEGGLERPPQQIRRFHPGIGFLVKRTGAPVLPVVVTGTPKSDLAWESLYRSSRSVVRYMAPIDYTKTGLDAAGITEDLRRRFLEWTGWPANDIDPD